MRINGMTKLGAKAAAQGLSGYFTGKPCKNGHVCMRHLSGNCVECVKATAARHNHPYYEANKKRLLAHNREYALKNREKIKEWNREYTRNRYRHLRQTDPQYKIRSALRSRLYAALKGIVKSRSTLELLGCSVEEAKGYLESLWLHGMNWDNHGNGVGSWQIDHIRHLSSFDLTDPEQQTEAFHFSNLQPLWHSDHLEKTKLERAA